MLTGVDIAPGILEENFEAIAEFLVDGKVITDVERFGLHLQGVVQFVYKKRDQVHVSSRLSSAGKSRNHGFPQLAPGEHERFTQTFNSNVVAT